jgi:hypothetical protein
MKSVSMKQKNPPPSQIAEMERNERNLFWKRQRGGPLKKKRKKLVLENSEEKVGDKHRRRRGHPRGSIEIKS